jgi:phage shock protein C
MEKHKKLYRSKTNRVFGGICAGLADFLNFDVTIIRLLWLLIVVFTGIVPGVLVYVIGLFIIPEEPPKVL